MAMVKIIDPSGWNFDRPVAVMIKQSSRGLVGSDRSDFIKVAGHAFLDTIDNGFKVAKDEVPVHLIALGATEYWGSNRNGDGFKEATCRQHHSSFVKHARWYQDHKNKDPKQSYGCVKQSAYSEPMHRVELLVMLNASKSACDRNGGHIAERSLEKLAAGGDVPVSMACKILFDKCSNCGNQAKTRADYCTEATCIGPRGEKRGGCRNNITKVGTDGHVLHVDNPAPQWFDISDVMRPADRTAYGARADYLEKAADHCFVPGAEMAENLGVTMPAHFLFDDADLRPSTRDQLKLASALASAETFNSLSPSTYMAFAKPGCIETETLQRILGRVGSEKAASALAKMADCKIILDLKNFAGWLNKAAWTAEAEKLLPDIFNRLTRDPDLGLRLEANPFGCFDKAASAALSPDFACFSLDSTAISERAMRAGLKQISALNLKTGFWNGEVSSPAVELAEAYGLYKLAALYRIAKFDHDFCLTARLAIGQNNI